MAGIEDALKFLDPKYIDKAKELLSDPKGSGAGILNAIKDFDPIEAANFVKDKVLETTFGEANVDDMIIGGGVGGQSTELPGILAQAGDYALDQAGLPINVSTLSDIGSAFTDQGTAGVVEVAKNQAINLIKNGLVNEGLALAGQAGISGPVILALANNKITGPIVRGAGNEFANLGFDLASNVPFFGNQFGNIYDAGLNIFGINRKRDKEPDPPAQLTNDQINQIIQDEEDLTKPPVVINQPQPQQDFPIINQGGGQGGNQGGGGNVVIGSSFTPPSTNVQQETNRIRDILDRRAQGSTQGFNSGGLIQKYNHGGLHKNPHTDTYSPNIDLSGILNDFKENPSIPDEIKDELMKYLLDKYMQEREQMKKREEDQYNQPPPTTLEAANGGLATIPRYLKGR